MNLNHLNRRYAAALLVLLGLSACTEKKPEHSQLSEQPPEATQIANVSVEHQSRFSTRARISYADLTALAEAEIPASNTGNGKQKQLIVDFYMDMEYHLNSGLKES